MHFPILGRVSGLHPFWQRGGAAAGLASQLIVSLLLSSTAAHAAKSGGEPIVIVADTRRLTGWQAWWGNLYNESHVYFTLMTIIVIPTVAVIFGLLTDFLLMKLGIGLRSRRLSEH